MIEWFRSGIFRKVLLSILAVSLVSLVVLGGLALRTTTESGNTAIVRSREALDTKSAEVIQSRTVETANAIASFLEEREADLRVLARLPCAIEAYRDFNQVHQGFLWYPQSGVLMRLRLPLYWEIACTDATGQEMVKIMDSRVATPEELRDVSDPANTIYKSETYFAEARQLWPGEIYVSRLTGFYVSKANFEAGKTFNGVVRFAMPRYSTDAEPRFEGIVVLALDSRHLEEFTAHIVPTEERVAAEPDPKTGNYAYQVDADGWVIAHPCAYYIRGLRDDGSLVPALNEANHQAQEARGEVPLNLAELGFKDPNLPLINEQAQMGQAASITYYWDGHDKFVAYAPIPYYRGPYAPPAGFGWVAIGADVETFHQAATLLEAVIQEKVRTLLRVTLVVLGLTVLAVLSIAGLLARHISAPIQCLIEAARSVERDEFQLQILDVLIQSRPEDEIVRLARVFYEMAVQVQKREQRLKQEVQQLRIEINEVKKAHQVAEITETEYFQQLQERSLGGAKAIGRVDMRLHG